MTGSAGPTSVRAANTAAAFVAGQSGQRSAGQYETKISSPGRRTYREAPLAQDCVGLVREYVCQYEALDKAERIWRRLAKTAGRSIKAVIREPEDWRDPIEACEQWRDQYEEAMTALVRHNWELDEDLRAAWDRFDAAQGGLSEAFEVLDRCDDGPKDPTAEEVISHLRNVQRFCERTARTSLGLRQVLIAEVKTLVRELERMIQ